MVVSVSVELVVAGLGLKAAVTTLHDRLAAGWWPDWTDRLAMLPRDWDSVARSMLAIATAIKSGPTPPDLLSRRTSTTRGLIP